MRNPHILRIAAGMLAVTALLTTSCKDTTEPVVTKVYAKAQFVHIAPEAPGLIASIDGNRINNDSLQYLQVLRTLDSSYIDVDVTAAGKRTIKLDSKTGNVTTDSLAMNQDTYYSFYAYSDTGAGKKTRVQIAADDLTAPAAGKIKLRIAQFISDIGTDVDVEVVPPRQSASLNNNFSAIKFKTVTNFIELPEGSYDIKLKRKGTLDFAMTVPVSAALTAGKVYTLVLRGYTATANTSGAFVTHNKK